MNPPNREKIIRLSFFSLLIAAGVYFLYLIRGLVLSIVLAVIITYLLSPLVNAMERRGTPRTIAILIAYLALVIIMASLVLYGVPRMLAQMNNLIEAVPGYARQAQIFMNNLHEGYDRTGLPPGLKNVIEERINWFEGQILNTIKQLVTAIMGLGGYVLNLLLAPFIAFYLIKDLSEFKAKLFTHLPRRWHRDLINLLKEMDRVVNSYIRGYMTVCLLVGIMTGTALALLGVEFALMLGILAGIAELIPYFGPVIGAIPAVALAMLTSKWLALKVILVFLLIHQLEGNLISPKILGSRVGLHPLLVILVLLAGGELFGLAGMLLAVPAAAILRVVFIFTYNRLVMKQY